MTYSTSLTSKQHQPSWLPHGIAAPHWLLLQGFYVHRHKNPLTRVLGYLEEHLPRTGTHLGHIRKWNARTCRQAFHFFNCILFILSCGTHEVSQDYFFNCLIFTLCSTLCHRHYWNQAHLSVAPHHYHLQTLPTFAWLVGSMCTSLDSKHSSHLLQTLGCAPMLHFNVLVIACPC